MNVPPASTSNYGNAYFSNLQSHNDTSYGPSSGSLLSALRLNASPTFNRLDTSSLVSPSTVTSAAANNSTSSNENSFASFSNSTANQMTVKYLEDRLEQERRAREQLEGELRLGKSMMTQFSSRLELLQNQVHLQQQKNALTAGSNQEGFGDASVNKQVKKEIERMSENVLSKVNQMMSEHFGLKTKLHDVHDSDMKRYKTVLDEVDQVKLLLSNYMSKASELHQDHTSKENMLMMEQSKASELSQVVLSHEQYLKALAKQMEAKWTQLDQSD